MKNAVAVLVLLLGAAIHVHATSPVRLPEALTAQRQLVASSPGDPGALNDLANLLVLKGQLDEAEGLYRQAADLAPEAAMIHYNLGLLLQQQDRHEEAIEEFQEIVEAVPEHAWGHYQLGLSFEALGGRGKAAIASYAEAFSIDPNLAFADVNPQVIDSRYLTTALLRASHRSPGRVVAPLSYHEPERIARILLPVPAAQADNTAADEAGPAPTEVQPTAAFSGNENSAPGEPGLPVDLTESERQRARAAARIRHQRSPTNRATPPTEDPSRPDPTSAEEIDQLFEDWAREAGSDDGDDFFQDFEPSQDSTGRLELRLLPATGDDEDDPDRLAGRSTQAVVRAR